jgi:hypothetical protein
MMYNKLGSGMNFSTRFLYSTVAQGSRFRVSLLEVCKLN